MDRSREVVGFLVPTVPTVVLVVGDRRHNLEVADHHIALAVASGKLAVVVVRHTDQQQRIVVAAAAVGGCCRRCCMGAAAVAAG